MSRSNTNLGTQRLEYDDVIWSKEEFYGISPIGLASASGTEIELKPLPPLDEKIEVNTPPLVLTTGMKADKDKPPYWIFKYKLDSYKGLVISDVKVKDTIETDSSEDVFERIEFGDLKIFFDDDTSIEIDIATILSFPQTNFFLSVGESGSGKGFNISDPKDELYQRGLKLDISSNILHPLGEKCYIFLSFSIVFRGAKNDFDPAGIPVAMVTWPQISFSWSNVENTKRVVKFMGSIKISMHNKMHATHCHSTGSDYCNPLEENISGLYTDSNTSIIDSNFAFSQSSWKSDRATYYSGFLADLAIAFRQPFGWALLFDYINKLQLNFDKISNIVTQKETEIIAVYGPDHLLNWSNQKREQRYEWIPGTFSPGIRVSKAPRQGMYDNMHNHARMTSLDGKGNIQIHAPFCGHSCVHTHWRWSGISSWGIVSDTPKYKGWSKNTLAKTEKSAKAFSEHGAPKVPPNQKIRVAICNVDFDDFDEARTPVKRSHSDNSILDSDVLSDLNPLRKMFWYRSEVFQPNAGEEQVLMEQGIGWAYRYATPTRFSTPFTPGFEGESDALDGLSDALEDDLPWLTTPSQQQISDFFENKVYPTFRYKENEDQVPEGSQDNLFSGGKTTSMENL